MSGIENRIPDETIRMGYQNFVDPDFWNPRDNEAAPGFVMIEGKPVLNTTTLEELGLEVSNNENDFSDPGARDVLNDNNRYRIRRSSAIRTRRRKGKGKRSTKRRNNRFGFKKAFGNLSKGLKKLTGKTRRQRGGGDNACKDYLTYSEPKPMDPAPQVKVPYSTTETEPFYKIMKELFTNKIDDNTFIILKIGSNDYPGSGHSGSKGQLFFQRYIDVKQGQKFINIAISPVSEYSGFMYPIEMIKDYRPNDLFQKFSNNGEKYYIQDAFPIAPTDDPKTNEILSYIINHKGSLLLLNAMGGYCYNIFKYILDMRIYPTGYGGYVDNSEAASCSFQKIYPNPEQFCRGTTTPEEEKAAKNKAKAAKNNAKAKEELAQYQPADKRADFIFENEKQYIKMLAQALMKKYYPDKPFLTISEIRSVEYKMKPDDVYTFLKKWNLLDKLKNTTKKRLLNVVSKNLLNA